VAPRTVAALPEQAAGPVRLYACVGKHCPDGRRVLDALRVAAADSGVAVAPCGCLDLCEQGPVVIALPAEAPPPRRGQPGPAPLATHLRVSPADAARIVATLERNGK
jgi:(2Fe-2S) ferredoxin